MKELNESPHKAFVLTKLNYIVLFVYIGVAFALFLISHDFSSYGLGKVMGKMLGTMVLSILAGYIVWLVSLKNNRAGEWGFNLMVIYISFSLMTSYYKAYQINQAALDVQQAEKTFDEAIKQTDQSRDAAVKVYDQFTESMFSGISKQLEHAEGTEREVLLIQQNYLKEIAEITQNWHTNLNQFWVKDVLDPSMLQVDPAVYDNRLKTIQNVLQSSLEYKEMMVTMENEIDERLKPLSLPKKTHKQIVETFMYSPDFSLEQIVTTVDAFVSYLDQTRKVLNIMNLNKDKWSFDGGDFFSEDDDFIMNYDYAIEKLWQKEAEVQEFFAKFYQ